MVMKRSCDCELASTLFSSNLKSQCSKHSSGGKKKPKSVYVGVSASEIESIPPSPPCRRFSSALLISRYTDSSDSQSQTSGRQKQNRKLGRFIIFVKNSIRVGDPTKLRKYPRLEL
ncbi:hypothetical protein YC2023_045790 [Brassica napus]